MTTTVTPNRLNAGYPWFRFSQDAGNKLMDWCVPAFSCGTIGGMWSDSTMPSKIGVSTEIKFHIADYSSCSTLLEVGLSRKFSENENDFIYKYGTETVTPGTRHCFFGLSGMAS